MILLFTCTIKRLSDISAEYKMLQLATDSLTLDFGYTFDLGGIKGALCDCVEKNTGFAGKIASLAAKIQSAADSLYKLYEAE